jgi:four helix bundle protein
MADDLVLRVYHATRGLPPEERFGLQAQLRRAAVPPQAISSKVARGDPRVSIKIL